MPNICIVSHTIYPIRETEEALEEFHSLQQKMLRAFDGDNTKSTPLYRLVTLLGGKPETQGINTRGEFDQPRPGYKNGNTRARLPIITFYEGTAYRPCSEAWSFIMSHFPRLEHAWVASEPGNRVFIKHDPGGCFYASHNIVIFTGDDEDEDVQCNGKVCANTMEVCDYINELYGEPETAENFEMAIARAQMCAAQNDSEFSVYAYKLVI